jgi:translation initiation factor IF-2
MSATGKKYRITKVATEFNVSWKTLVEHLKGKGFEVEEKISAKIDQEMYNVLASDFHSEKKAKEESISLKQSLKKDKETTIAGGVGSKRNETKPESEFEDIILIKDTGIHKKAEAPEPKQEEKIEQAEKEPEVESVEEAPVKEEEKEAPVEEKDSSEVTETIQETPKEEAEENDGKLRGPKVVGKIELEDKPKPSKQKKSEEEKPKDTSKKEEPEKTTETTDKDLSTEKAEGKEKEGEGEKEGDEDTMKKTQYEKLKGLSVKGKIDVSKFEKKKEDKADGQERKKRKRKPKAERVDPNKLGPKDRNRRRDRKGDSKEEISEKEIQDKIKATLAKIGGQKGSSHGGNIRSKARKQKKFDQRQQREEEALQSEIDSKTLKVTEFVTANELASLMDVQVTEIISACFSLGMMVSINQRLDAETIQIVSEEFGFSVEFVDADTQIDIEEEEDKPEDLLERPPIVTVMGHVDHGKTSLLDYIRSANVIAGEAGGITQHVAAYEVVLKDKRKLTFIDTPGHEAFTAMRARGAKVTDLAIIVIAADDSVMPQTKEAISHAQAAGVPMVFAFNKMDKDGANADRIREELANMNILVEDWGGKYQAQEISAKKGLNIDELLDKVLLEAELLELKANPQKKAKGTVLEARLDKGRGTYVSLLVQEGTLKIGDSLVAGSNFARIKAMFNERGQRVTEAGPATPVGVLGFSNPPTAGDVFQVMTDEQEAKEIANKREQLVREQGIRTKKHITLEEIGRRLAVGNFKELNIVIKGDVDGSVEALSDSLLKLSTEEIQVNVILKAVGPISENDVLLASASDAVVIGFQVRPTPGAKKLAESEEIEIKTYSVIYQAIEEIKSAMEGMLSPEFEEKITGTVEIREIFKISKVGTIAGCMVTDGKILRSSKIRLIREGVVIFSGEVATLKRFKDDVKEVSKGFECGIQIKNNNDIQVGDVIEVYEQVEVKRKL